MAAVMLAWLFQFGGHHLALNIAIVGDQDVLTPSIKASALNEEQQAMLLDLALECVGIMNDERQWRE